MAPDPDHNIAEHRLSSDLSVSATTKSRSVPVSLSAALRDSISNAISRFFENKHEAKLPSGEVISHLKVQQYARRAERPLASALARLQLMGHPSLAGTIEVLYPKLIPLWIEAGTKSPLHHTSYVLNFLSTILNGEGVQRSEVEAGLLAALFHDASLGRSRLPKITEQHLKHAFELLREGEKPRIPDVRAHLGYEPQTVKEWVESIRALTIRTRTEHMNEGAAIARHMLQAYRKELALEVADALTAEVVRIISHHDDPKILLIDQIIERTFGKDPQWWSSRGLEPGCFRNHSSKAFLIGSTDTILQLHHEADALWMVTEDGIMADLDRFPIGKRPTALETLKNNAQAHRAEPEVYEAILPLEDFRGYGFQNHTLYRSTTGYALFAEAEARLMRKFTE